MSWIPIAAKAAPVVLGLLGNIFGGKKKETQYSQGFSPEQKALFQKIAGGVDMLRNRPQMYPSVSRDVLNAKSLIYKMFGMQPPGYFGVGYTGNPAGMNPSPQGQYGYQNTPGWNQPGGPQMGPRRLPMRPVNDLGEGYYGPQGGGPRGPQDANPWRM